MTAGREWLGPALLVGAVAVGMYLRREKAAEAARASELAASEAPPPVGTMRREADAAGTEYDQRFDGEKWVTQVTVSRPVSRGACPPLVAPGVTPPRPSAQPWPTPRGLEVEARRIWDHPWGRDVALKGTVIWRWGDAGARLGGVAGEPVFPLCQDRHGRLHIPILVHSDELPRLMNHYIASNVDLVPTFAAGWHLAMVQPSGRYRDIFDKPWTPDATDRPFHRVGTRCTPELQGYIWTRRGTLPSRAGGSRRLAGGGYLRADGLGWQSNGHVGYVHCSELATA